MSFIRATIRKIISEENKYYIHCLPVDKKNNPSGEPAVHCCFSEIDFNKTNSYKTEFLDAPPPLAPGEKDYCLNHVLTGYSLRDGKPGLTFKYELSEQIFELIKRTYLTEESKGEVSSLGASYFVTRGARNNQEDAHIIIALDDLFATLDESEVKQALLDAFSEAQTLFGQESWGGSTAIVCLVLNKKIYIASLGDSTAYSVTDLNVERLNAELHDKELDNNRHCLAVNGAIGDKDFSEVIHIPNIYIKEIRAEDIEKQKLILSCDGLTEASKLVKNKKQDDKPDVTLLKKMLTNHINFTPEILTRSAILEHNSTDNVTVIQVHLKTLLQQHKAALFAVFDGHGGKTVSQNLEKYFTAILTWQLKKMLERKQTANVSSHPATFYSQEKIKTTTEEKNVVADTTTLKPSFSG